ncbi:phosphate ABC transporter substrate-binding protein [Massilia sp. Dwa41.01b]|uniref:phosphate ABC transporter substrate-binding protein n=1 Tax=unclassified Massilia TaxID=2609279 RepID=UPI0016020154|nr:MULTISPECIES: phosphate ABC transporter substrate-binding protein [unclassified Massilia]QNA87266.1 phosphate ABC transporter substrate-binding protein [Massilia sp. Dwa41.01b]QNA98170.1 phosphate ABC transporter substrate-binding protein [Massilia sp. Se16.2.3]
MKPFLNLTLSALLVAGAALAGPALAQTVITATGASTIAPLMSEVGKHFEKANPQVRVEVQSGGTSRGIADVRQGSARIGMVSRALHEDEKKDLEALLIARDGVAMVVHKSNPVKALTREQIIAIYTGKVKNWKEVGGADAPITVISKAEGRSTLEVFTHYFGVTPRDIKAQIIIGDNQQEIRTVSTNKGAIGYVSIGSAEYEASHGTPIKMLALGNLVPSTQSVASGAYPIARDLNLVYRKPLSKDESALLAYMSTPAAKKEILAQFFIPVATAPVVANSK